MVASESEGAYRQKLRGEVMLSICVSVREFATEQSGDNAMTSQESVRKVPETSRHGGHMVALVMESEIEKVAIDFGGICFGDF